MLPLSNIELNDNEVHIWSAYLPEYEGVQAYTGELLSKEENERAHSFTFKKDSQQFTSARSILKCLLAGYLTEEPQKIGITYGPWGKPCLIEKTLFFNVSHSKNHALFAITKNYEVGIDLEFIDKDLDFKNLSKVIFSEKELIYWKYLSPSDQLIFFYKSWVAKEAYLKAIGKGWLAEDQNISFNFDFHLSQNLMKETPIEGVAYPYFFNLIPDFASALFVEGPPLKVIPFHYTFSKQK